MREMVFGLDADFSEEAFVGRLNADLANDLGNLASRASTLLVNFAGGVVPPTPRAADAGAKITIDDFARVDLRVAQVVAAEAIPKSKKLLKLRVSLGAEERTVLAGIAEHYTPGDLVGKKVVVVANLQPAKLMGIESQGMLLAGSADSALGVVMPDRDL